MKRILILTGWLSGALACLAPVAAQDTAAANIAAREEAEANAKRINAKVEQLEETFQAQAKRMNALVDEIHSLRAEVDRLRNRNESAATQESIKRLADKIEEVDKKRQADNELVVTQLKEIRKGLSKPIQAKEPVVEPPPARPKTTETPAPTKSAATTPDNGFTYNIKDGDTLVRIVKDLKAINVVTTQKQIMDANPNVNWNKLKIGQTILIPQSAP